MKDDVVDSLNLQLEQMQLTRHLYPEIKALMESVTSAQQLVVSLPDMTETVQRTYGIVRGLDQSRLGMSDLSRLESTSLLTYGPQTKIA